MHWCSPVTCINKQLYKIRSFSFLKSITLIFYTTYLCSKCKHNPSPIFSWTGNVLEGMSPSPLLQYYYWFHTFMKWESYDFYQCYCVESRPSIIKWQVATFLEREVTWYHNYMIPETPRAKSWDHNIVNSIPIQISIILYPILGEIIFIKAKLQKLQNLLFNVSTIFKQPCFRNWFISFLQQFAGR